MKEVKFLHCADMHLDMPFTSLGIDDNKPSIRRVDLKDTFQKIINISRKEEVDMIFICGDLYEHSYARKSTINFINHAFESISDIKVFIIPGNHDPWVKGSYYMNYEWANNVYILNSENPYVYVEENGITVYDPYAFTNREMEINPDDINVLLTHGTVDLNIDGNSYNPMRSSELVTLGVDYIALGHFHKRIDNIGEKGIIYNPGSPEPLGFDEPGEHGVYIGTIVKRSHLNVDLSVDFKAINRRYYEELRVDITGCITDQQVIHNIMNNIMDKVKMLSSDIQSNLSSFLVSVVLYGYIDPQYNIDMEYILSFFKDRVFYIKIKNEAMPDYDFESIKKEPGLKGLFTRKVLELVDKTTGSYEKELLMKSLHYGIQALEKEQVDIV